MEQGPLNVFQWYNVIFLGPAFLAAFWLIYTIATGIGHDVDFDGDVDHDHDFDHMSFGASVFDFLHLRNRCPKTLGFSILFLTWGALGYVINISIVKLPDILFLPAFVCNVFAVTIVAIIVVRIAAPLIAKTMPSVDYQSSKPVDLIGKRGKVSTLMSVEDGGHIVIYLGGRAPLIKKAVFVEGYEGGTLQRNAEVLIVEMDGDTLVCTPVF